MPRIVLGYGDFKGHTLAEVPDETLKELSVRFPLQSERYDPSDGYSLLLTVAVHEEMRRRQEGGQRKARVPTIKELANQMVNHGFRHLSKTHHPDRNGSQDAQRRLNEVKAFLINACTDMRDDTQDAIVIAPAESEFSDDDIPF